jgi:hypothetical protein
VTLAPPPALAAGPPAPSLRPVADSASSNGAAAEENEEHEENERGGVVEAPDAWGYGPYGYGYGYGWDSPFCSPWWYGPPYRRPAFVRPRVAGEAKLVLHVHPHKAEVKVDGVDVGQARDFDLAGSPLWLTPGDHEVDLSYPGYRTLKREVDAKAGLDEHLHYRLEHGQGLDPRSDAPQGSGTAS